MLVQSYTLENTGLKAEILNVGGAIRSLYAPDRNGDAIDVVHGLEDPEEYLDNPSYFGALVGRYANQIAYGRFTLNGRQYNLARNFGGEVKHNLHGGDVGFNKVIWDVLEVKRESILLQYISPDGDEGFPGEVATTVEYSLSDNALCIDYTAKTDQPTVVSLTNHAYFNLNGHDAPTVLDHELLIAADAYTPIDAGGIPSGEIRDVSESPFDFRTAKPIGRDIDADDIQISYGNGYDHNYVLNGSGMRFVASLSHVDSGRCMEVWTTKPGMQLYTSNYLDGSVKGKGGVCYPFRSAVCLETQYHPDSPNHPGFPSTVLNPGEIYHHRTEYRFS